MTSPNFIDDASALGAQCAGRKRDNALHMNTVADIALKTGKEKP